METAAAAPSTPVFISYSTREYPYACAVADALRQSGHDVWQDVDNLIPGTDWADALEQALASCGSLVLIWSHAAKQSPNVRTEWQTVTAAHKPVHVVLFEPARLPPELKPASVVNGIGSFAAAMTRLDSSVRAGQGERARVLPLPLPLSLVYAPPTLWLALLGLWLCPLYFALLLTYHALWITFRYAGVAWSALSTQPGYFDAIMIALGVWALFVPRLLEIPVAATWRRPFLGTSFNQTLINTSFYLPYVGLYAGVLFLAPPPFLSQGSDPTGLLFPAWYQSQAFDLFGGIGFALGFVNTFLWYRLWRHQALARWLVPSASFEGGTGFQVGSVSAGATGATSTAARRSIPAALPSRATVDRATEGASVSLGGTYQIHYAVADARGAQSVRSVLEASGWRQATAESEPDHHIGIASNRTSRDEFSAWLRAHPSMLWILGSNIEIPPQEVAAFRTMQWIDNRRGGTEKLVSAVGRLRGQRGARPIPLDLASWVLPQQLQTIVSILRFGAALYLAMGLVDGVFGLYHFPPTRVIGPLWCLDGLLIWLLTRRLEVRGITFEAAKRALTTLLGVSLVLFPIGLVVADFVANAALGGANFTTYDGVTFPPVTAADTVGLIANAALNAFLYAIPFGSLLAGPRVIGFSSKSLWSWLPDREQVPRARLTLSVPYRMHLLAKDRQFWLTVALLVAVIVQITQTGFLH